MVVVGRSVVSKARQWWDVKALYEVSAARYHAPVSNVPITADSSPPTDATVAAYRVHRCQYEVAARLRHLGEAVEWLRTQGLVLLFPQAGVPLPSLWEGVNGGPRALPHHTHHDPALGRLWGWKDTILGEGQLYYGKALRGHPGFISRDLLPLFYAAAGRLGDDDDYENAFRDGLLSEDARRVCAAVVEYGPATTGELRRQSGLYGRGDPSRRFDRAISELQRGLFIVPVAVADTNAWKYCFVYDLLPRRFPDEVERASHLPQRQAARELLLAYLGVVGADTLDSCARLLGQPVSRVLAELRHPDIAPKIGLEGESVRSRVWLRELFTEG